MTSSTIKTSFILLLSIFHLFSGNGYQSMSVMAETGSPVGDNDNVIIYGTAIENNVDDVLGTECQAELDAAVGCLFGNSECLEKCGVLDDGDGNIGDMTNTDLGSCADVNTQFCSQLTCCPACFDQVQVFGECVTASAGIDCDLDCESSGESIEDNNDSGVFADGDNGDNIFGDDDILADCQAEIGAAFGCLFSNAECVEKCSVVDSSGEGDMSDMTNLDLSSCSDLNTQFCTQLSCCPACFDPLEALGECTTKSAGINCDFECSGASSVTVATAGLIMGLVYAVLG